MTDINQYLDFVMKMFLAFGLAFEIPVATLLMVWSGLTTQKPWLQAPLHYYWLFRARNVSNAARRGFATSAGATHVVTV